MSADALAVLVPVAGGLASPLVPERARRWFLLAVAVATFAALGRLEPGAREQKDYCPDIGLVLEVTPKGGRGRNELVDVTP